MAGYRPLVRLMRVHIGIVLYNNAPDLPRCLAAVRAQTHPDLTITCFDNASNDDGAAWLRANAPDVRLLVSGRNLGFGRGHNAMIAERAVAADEAYLALNPDCEIAPDYLERLIPHLQAGYGWAGGKLLLKGADGSAAGLIYSAGHALTRGGYAFNIGYGLPDDGRFDAVREVFGASGAAALYSGRLIAALGGSLFDPRFFMYGEDTELDWRARRGGWRCCYEPGATALHRGSTPPPELNAQVIGNRYLGAVKHASRRDLFLRVLPMMLAHTAVRIVVTPRMGIRLARHVARWLPSFWRSRTPAGAADANLEAWYAWSAQQPSAKPPSVFRRVWGRFMRGMRSTKSLR